MTRPLRLEFPGALFHVMSRGNAKQSIFLDDVDRELYLTLLGRCVERSDWILPKYSLMPNHVHLVIQLRCNTLSKGMQWLNSEYARIFNGRHRRVGHVFQGRFKAILVEKESYYLNVVRYVVLNAVAAEMVAAPEHYKWSSHRATIGDVPAPPWLAVDDVLAQFSPDREVAIERYRAFVNAAAAVDDDPFKNVVGQAYLGSDEWREKIVGPQIALKPRSDDYPVRQRVIGNTTMQEVIAVVASTLKIDHDCVRRNGLPRLIAAWLGWNEVLLTHREIAAALRLRSAGQVSRLVQRCEREIDASAAAKRCIDLSVSTIRGKKAQSKV